MILGDEEYIYDANHYLVTPVGLPVVSNVTEASKEAPPLRDIKKLQEMVRSMNLGVVRRHE